MNPQDPKYQQKSKAISSAEPNYFVHSAMRYPVVYKIIIMHVHTYYENNIKVVHV